jgi:hypothetical protein
LAVRQTATATIVKTTIAGQSAGGFIATPAASRNGDAYFGRRDAAIDSFSRQRGRVFEMPLRSAAVPQPR